VEEDAGVAGPSVAGPSVAGPIALEASVAGPSVADPSVAGPRKCALARKTRFIRINVSKTKR